ncbi:hypothetical protein LTR62_003848 [Meristemomyces frigidus]|uniref:Peptidase A1 domain-containing protein n=1 Tax=Meristemomyces frigidus TaxID=1508187 RepID=A0AAN7TNE5_9PEZI|nr:hypothetical protein LTR62_003848 [Meristemomyces frigidus]
MDMGRLPRSSGNQKRGPQSVNVGNAESDGIYYVNASVGTPPQVLQLQLDTGSSDLWMFGSSLGDCSACLGGFFDPSQSSTYQLLAPGAFQIQYVTPGSGVIGDYISDNVSIGNIHLRNLTMAVASQAQQVVTGVMGIAFDADEALVGQGYSPYPNIIDAMVQQGVIATRAYSLYLDDLEANTGAILFGGYDTSKFIGDLTLLDIQPNTQQGTLVSTFTVVWSLLTLTDNTGTTIVGTTTDYPLPAVLDSGTTLTYIPTSLLSPILTYFGAISDNSSAYLVPCNISSLPGTLDFRFGSQQSGPIISVPFSELAPPAYNTSGDPMTFTDGTAACQFGLAAADETTPIIFGDTFLRSAYVVYDLDSLQIGIANANWNSSGRSNVVAITSNGTSGGGGGEGGYISASSALGASVTQTATGGHAAPGAPGKTLGQTVSHAAAGSFAGRVSALPGAKTSFGGVGGAHGLGSTVTTAPAGGGGSSATGSGSGKISGSGSGTSGGSTATATQKAAAAGGGGLPETGFFSSAALATVVSVITALFIVSFAIL